MFRPSAQAYDWHQRGCALVVIVAVCALTVSLATRFVFFDNPPMLGVTTVHHHVSAPPSRQRLIGTATAWNAPLTRTSLLDSTCSYRRMAPTGPRMLCILFEKSLYNRPPPSSHIIPA